MRSASSNNDGNINEFSTGELLIASDEIIKRVQSESFVDVINILKAKKCLPRSNKYISLSPFLDDTGLLRVGGRLKNANISYDAQHQILLPNDHSVTKLIIQHCHEVCLHGGPKLTESIVRQKYWICASQCTIKSVLSKCVACFRVAPKPLQQYMGVLPEVRVNMVQKPFVLV